ncbi:MAG: M42 family metallopeptidase [Bacteroidota bacterium]|jgi:putative aminopeptidase FrvX|nr:M42 family metallopeptidase [Bacteroidota bacterium]
MSSTSHEFLQKYLNNASPTGYEASGQRIWLDYIKPYTDSFFTDTYGTAVGVINSEASYKVVIEAHADEIAWFVNFITDDGYLYVKKNGGSDHQIAPSMRVNIHTREKMVKGVFGWPAIHVRTDDKEVTPNIKNIFIDCGCSSKDEVLKLGIHVGTVVTFENEMFTLNERYYVGRALDNRIGGFIIAEVLRKLKENKNKLPFGLYVVNSVQEEIGLRGAQMIAHRIKPNLAIITDVCHDTHSPLYNKKESGDIKAGNGPVLTYGAAVHHNVLEMLIKVAEEKEIKFQRAAASRSTGTDTDSFAYSNEGVPSALISLPLKYMHTTVETAHKDDVQHVITLMYEFLIQLKEGHNFSYIQ